MRIAYVCADRGVPVYGTKGCSLHVQEVIRALVSQGATVELFAATISGEAVSDLESIPTHKIRSGKFTERAAREQADLAANADILTQLQNNGPFDLVYERYSLWCTAGMQYAMQHDLPGVLEVNAPLIVEQQKYRGLIDVASATRVAKACFRAASVLVAVSEGIADYLECFREARGKIHVIPNGVNTERFPVKPERTNNQDSPFTIGFVGTLKPWHGLNDLMDSFTVLRRTGSDARLLIVGDGPEADNLHARIAREALGDVVEMTGAVSPDSIPRLLARMDLGTAPYPDDPAFYFSPLKVYEYMAAGLPVVASRIGQIDGLVVHEQTGLLYPPGDTDALACALSSLETDCSLGVRLGSAARRTVIELHSWKRRVQVILQMAIPENSPQYIRGTS